MTTRHLSIENYTPVLRYAMEMTQLPLGLGSMDFDNWFRGICAGFIGGGAGALTTGFSATVVDSDHFNVHTNKLWSLIGMSFLVNGIIGAAAFLHQNPMPGLKTVTQTTVQADRTDPAVTVITKTEETHVESLDLAKKPDGKAG